MKSSNEPILEGELFDDIKEEDSTWTIRECLITIPILLRAIITNEGGILLTLFTPSFSGGKSLFNQRMIYLVLNLRS